MKKLRFFGLLAAAVLLAFALVISCGGGEEPGIVEPPTTETPVRPIPQPGGGTAYVPPAPTYQALVLNRTQIAVVIGGAGETLSVIGASPRPIKKWDSDDPATAAVNSSGLVTGVKEGRATIWATANDDSIASCEVIVISNDPAKFIEKFTTPSDLTWAEIDALINKIGLTGVGGKAGLSGLQVTTLSNLVIDKFEKTTNGDINLLVTNAKNIMSTGITTPSEVIISYGDKDPEGQLALSLVLGGAPVPITLAQGWAFAAGGNSRTLTVPDQYEETVFDLVYTMPIAKDTVSTKKLVIYPSAKITVSGVIAPPTTNTKVALTTDTDVAIAEGTAFMRVTYTTPGDPAVQIVAFTPGGLNAGTGVSPIGILARASDPENNIEIAENLVKQLNNFTPAAAANTPRYTLTSAFTAGTGTLSGGFYSYAGAAASLASRNYDFAFKREPTVIPYIRLIGILASSESDLLVAPTSESDIIITTPANSVLISAVTYINKTTGKAAAATTPRDYDVIATFTLKPKTTDSNLIIAGPTLRQDSDSITGTLFGATSTIITTSGADAVAGRTIVGGPDDAGAWKISSTYPK
ncbi:MAG: Ig-like domain-containing protein [Treponema sp.]|jgi:hypothetical protein|nr:Ig-like domain-containing protein [Treponema sp.]